MHLTPPSLFRSNNIAFGYNKRLNNQLVERLNQNPDSPVNKTLLAVNETCNNTENALKRLEGRDFQNFKKNENTISILSGYLVDAKSYLARTVDRLYPELGFSKKESDGYQKDAEHAEFLYESQYGNAQRKESDWRCQLTNNLGWQDYLEYVDEDEAQKEEAEFEKNRKSFMEELLSAPDGSKSGEAMVEKFIPFSYSPTSLDDVVGLRQSIDDIEDLILFPLEQPEGAKEREEKYGIKSPGFVMFFGPPGCGKTMLAEAIAAESGCDMYKLDLSKFGSSYVNGTAVNVSKAFEYVIEQAQQSDKPVILFMDELDSVLSQRSSGEGSKEDNKVVNTLLPLLTQAQENNILVIGATNMYDSLDAAAKRRVDMNCYIGLPNGSEIQELLAKRLSTFKMGQDLASNKDALNEISKELVGYSPSIINKVVKAASKIAYKEARAVEQNDFDRALKEGAWEKINEKEYKPENKQTQMGFHP